MSLVNELAVATEAARHAGAAIQRYASGELQVRDKSSGTTQELDPVTAADLEADGILKEQLLRAFPDDGWLSEETEDDARRLACERVWVVDPLDGTREFVGGRPEYAVSVALVQSGEPVLGVVFNPARDELFTAAVGEPLTRNGSVVRTRTEVHTPLQLYISRSEYRRGQFERIEGQAELQAVGSIAYKLARIAAGEADACISLAPKSEWDIAAGVALIQAGAGHVVGLDGSALSFNQPTPKLAGLVASSEGSLSESVALVALGRIQT